MGLIFAGRPVISGRLANRNGSRIGANKKKLRGVIAPISTTNDYLDTVVDDVVSQRWSKKKCSPTVPSEKLQFDGILSLRVKSLSAQDDKKGILFVDRPVK